MSKHGIGKNCQLTQYLEEVSGLDGDGLKAQLAGALLFGLGYPTFTQTLPEVTITAPLVQQILNASENNFMLEAAEKCALCPQSANCKVGGLIQIS
jgi:hypothetical protein